MSAYHLGVTLHVLAALLWLGGMFFLAAVGAPVLRRVEPPALRARLFRELGERFRAVGWACIGVLLVTGTANLWFRGWWGMEVWGSGAFWASRPGRALGWKLAAVAVMVAASAVHDFVQGPRAARLAPGTPEAVAARSRAAWLARVNAAVGIVLVAVAVRLARGG